MYLSNNCQRVGNRIFSNPPLTFCVQFLYQIYIYYFSCLHLKPRDKTRRGPSREPWFPDSQHHAVVTRRVTWKGGGGPGNLGSQTVPDYASCFLNKHPVRLKPGISTKILGSWNSNVSIQILIQQKPFLGEMDRPLTWRESAFWTHKDSPHIA